MQLRGRMVPQTAGTLDGSDGGISDGWNLIGSWTRSETADADGGSVGSDLGSAGLVISGLNADNHLLPQLASFTACLPDTYFSFKAEQTPTEFFVLSHQLNLQKLKLSNDRICSLPGGRLGIAGWVHIQRAEVQSAPLPHSSTPQLRISLFDSHTSAIMIASIH
ncbi:hypothetical protein Tco_0546779 [Tanacetum coccineum]